MDSDMEIVDVRRWCFRSSQRVVFDRGELRNLTLRAERDSESSGVLGGVLHVALLPAVDGTMSARLRSVAANL